MDERCGYRSAEAWGCEVPPPPYVLTRQKLHRSNAQYSGRRRFLLQSHDRAVRIGTACGVHVDLGKRPAALQATITLPTSDASVLLASTVTANAGRQAGTTSGPRGPRHVPRVGSESRQEAVQWRIHDRIYDDLHSSERSHASHHAASEAKHYIWTTTLLKV